MDRWKEGRVSPSSDVRSWGDGSEQLLKTGSGFRWLMITNATEQAHTHLIFRCSHSSCALTGAAKQDEHGKYDYL